MNYVAYFPDGRIQQAGSCQDGSMQLQGGPDTLKIEVPDLIDPAAFYVADGEPVPIPERPSTHHEFNYTTKQWVPNNVRAWATCRYQRDQLLAGTDWRVTKAMESGEPMPAGWTDYRQALRDVTNQSDPTAIEWPVPPA